MNNNQINYRKIMMAMIKGKKIVKISSILKDSKKNLKKNLEKRKNNWKS